MFETLPLEYNSYITKSSLKNAAVSQQFMKVTIVPALSPINN